MSREPDVYVERCTECPAHRRWEYTQFTCRVEKPGVIRVVPYDRAFPRWCPLLKGPVTLAAIRKGAK